MVQTDFLKEVEVAQLIRAVSTLRNDRLYRRGLPYIKVGRSVRYSKDDILQYMESNKIKQEQKQEK
ncbi:MAG: helix-turn-helix domain-containing protein [Thermodesulfobacteriota bacterium]